MNLIIFYYFNNKENQYYDQETQSQQMTENIFTPKYDRKYYVHERLSDNKF